MIRRTTPLVLLVMALFVTAGGCEKKTEQGKYNDVPVTGSSGTNKKGKGQAIEAGVQYPPK